jgi:lipoprotein-anchoring transpeptidase ErfK/SrfK
MLRIIRLFKDNGAIASGAIIVTGLVLLGSTALAVNAAEVRYRRDVHRIGFNHNWDLLDDVKRQVGSSTDSLRGALEASPEPPADRPYVVVSIADRRLWYKQGASTLFTTQVAVGSGKSLVKESGHEEWKFDTPRGRLVVEKKEIDPVWVPPDWHYLEVARKKGLGVVRLGRNQTVPTSDGGVIAVAGSDVVKRARDGFVMPFEVAEGREIIAGGNIIIPPFGTNQRKYLGVLGTHRLYLGDGYGLHGTDQPESIGQAVSHGCVRLRNEDIAYLYSVVPVGTPVYIY